MLEVSEAANRIYLLSSTPPRQKAVIRLPDGRDVACGLRAFNPLGENWRVVYEVIDSLAEAAELLGAESERTSRSDVEFDLIAGDYTFWFSGPEITGLPKLVTDIQKLVRAASSR